MKNVKLKYKDDTKYEANRTDEECEVEVQTGDAKYKQTTDEVCEVKVQR